MKIISLNYNGLGIPKVVQELCYSVREKGPFVLFLCEAQLGIHGFVNLKKKLGLTQGIEVPRELSLVFVPS